MVETVKTSVARLDVPFAKTVLSIRFFTFTYHNKIYFLDPKISLRTSGDGIHRKSGQDLANRTKSQIHNVNTELIQPVRTNRHVLFSFSFSVLFETFFC